MICCEIITQKENLTVKNFFDNTACSLEIRFDDQFGIFGNTVILNTLVVAILVGSMISTTLKPIVPAVPARIAIPLA